MSLSGSWGLYPTGDAGEKRAGIEKGIGRRNHHSGQIAVNQGGGVTARSPHENQEREGGGGGRPHHLRKGKRPKYLTPGKKLQFVEGFSTGKQGTKVSEEKTFS